MFSCFTGYTAWILQHLDIYGSLWLFGLIATFALWVFYGRFGCLLLLVWKTWQHSVLGLQYLTWQLMSTSIVGSFNGKNRIDQQVILVCTHRCYVFVRVPLCSSFPLQLCRYFQFPTKFNLIAASFSFHEISEARRVLRAIHYSVISWLVWYSMTK